MLYINKNIFFRIYNDEVFVADTKLDKYYIFNESMGEILSFIKRYPGSSAEDLQKYFSRIYGTDSAEIKDDLALAVNELLHYQIIYDDFNIENYMTMRAIEKKQLYHALIELTYRCNLSCKHCYAETSCRNEMSTEQIKHIIDDLGKMNVMYLTFTGGEVFVRKDFIEIFDYAVEKGFVIEIFSNGVITNDAMIRHISSKYIKCFHCSVYSHNPQVHDSITGQAGSFEKTIKTLKEFKRHGIKINIKTAIMNENKDCLEGLIELADNIGATLQVGLNITPKNSGDLTPTQLRINSVCEYENILRTLNKAEGRRVELLKPPERSNDDNLCGAGLCSISINPYGEVFPCNGMTVKIGDINESSIKEMWENSGTLKEVRSKTFACVEGCRKCELKSYCNFCMGQAMLENNGKLNKYNEACMLAKASFNIQETILRKGEEI